MVYLYGLAAPPYVWSVMRIRDLMNVMFEFCYFCCIRFGQCGKSGNSTLCLGIFGQYNCMNNYLKLLFLLSGRFNEMLE